jgi:hypothetical protein
MFDHNNAHISRAVLVFYLSAAKFLALKEIGIILLSKVEEADGVTSSASCHCIIDG